MRPNSRKNRSGSQSEAAKVALSIVQSKAQQATSKAPRNPKVLLDTTRKMPSVLQPTYEVLDFTELQTSGNLDHEILKEHFKMQGRLKKSCVMMILEKVEALMKAEPNVLRMKAPVVVVGDIHGQFYDLLTLFTKAGEPELNKYLFLGDYVDRGVFSFECMIYLFFLKLALPDRIFLIRGNHETRAMTAIHSFKDEILHKFDEEIYNHFMKVFDAFPIAAVLTNAQGDFFCCHGGLSPLITTIEEIEKFNRFVEPEDETLFMDLLWADPMEESSTNQRYKDNYRRDCSYCFGYDAMSDFLERNKVVSIIRAHEVKENGYEQHWYKKLNPELKIPPCITVFSAPNYCDSYSNSGAYLKLDIDIYTLHQFSWVDHPYVLPKFSNAFLFSLPFVLENAMQVLVRIMQALAAAYDKDDQEEETKEKLTKPEPSPFDTRLRQATEQMLKIKNWRENNALAVQRLSLDASVISYGRSISVGAVMSKKKSWFETVKDIDKENEKLVFENPSAMANQRRLRRTQTFKV
uniref:Serine/threonine-protein phosphatase n=1 Tax=Arcella intermedia TaxID=1963864 RepID=A0A6B2L187_9EUKA